MQAVHHELRKMPLRAILALFLLPLIVWGFSQHVLTQQDAMYSASLEREIQASGASGDTDAANIAMLRANTPSRVCASDDPAAIVHKARMCASMGEIWQFYWARKISVMAFFAGALLLLTVTGLGLAAFRGREAQYRSLVLAWRTLALASAAEVILQSCMALWLSFWLTAWFFEVYFVKLVILVAIGAGVAVLAAVAKIFARSQSAFEVDGETVSESDAPALWQRIRALAAQLQTAPPDHLVAGVDNNFFVTESAVTLREQVLTGRTLFVSLPLMRVLGQHEADAVLAHELAHLQGGDTASSAQLGPKLVQFDRYRHEMSGLGLTVIAFYLLSLYRLIFELAWKRDSREREFMADRTAAGVLGGDAVSHSLIKVIAYSAYRGKVEADLFARDERHGESIGIAAFVAQGLLPFAGSDAFLPAMGTVDVPHPFDTHPSLEERMRNVGSVVPVEKFEAVLKADVVASWTNEITTAEAIEARLWAQYEARFSLAHEVNLAYRYLPLTDAERELVEKYFPARVFDMKKGKVLTVAYNGLQLPGEQALLAWDDVANLEYTDGYGGDELKVTIVKGCQSGKKSGTVKLPGIKQQRDALKEALGQYWHRHKVSRSKD
jgi:Zn-dependent protease with chaperone function